MLEDRSTAFGASAQGFLRREVDDFATVFALLVVTKVKFQLVVFGFLIKFDHHLGHKGPAGLGAEAVQGANFAILQKLLDLSRLEGAPGGGFAKRETAAFFGAGFARAGIAAVVLLNDAAAVWAGCCQRGVVTGNGVAVVFLGFLDHALGHGGNLGHELFAAELALLHLRQLVFPLASQLGLGELLNVQAAQQRH